MDEPTVEKRASDAWRALRDECPEEIRRTLFDLLFDLLADGRKVQLWADPALLRMWSIEIWPYGHLENDHPAAGYQYRFQVEVRRTECFELVARELRRVAELYSRMYPPDRHHGIRGLER